MEDVIDTYRIPKFSAKPSGRSRKLGCAAGSYSHSSAEAIGPIATVVFPADALAEIAQQLAADVNGTYFESPMPRRLALAH